MSFLKTTLAASLLFVQAARADSEHLKNVLEAQHTCSNFVRFDESHLFLGYGPYLLSPSEVRKPIPSSFQVIPLSGGEGVELQTKDSAIDFSAGESNHFFILTYSSIEEWDLSSQTRVAEYPTRLGNDDLRYRQHAQAMARYKDKLVIAHGRLGVSLFDINQKKITKQLALIESQRPYESSAMGVTVVDKYALVTMDDYTLVKNGKPAFRGIVVIDLESERVVKELVGLDPGADLVLSDGVSLFVGYGGSTIWKYPMKVLNGTALPSPWVRVFDYGVKGMPIGKAEMDEKYVYTCFLKAPEEKGGAYRKVPLALDRAAIKLD